MSAYSKTTIDLEEYFRSPQVLARWIGGAILLFVVILVVAQGTYVIQPGDRGVKVTLGKVSPEFLPEGLGFKTPMITRIVPVMVRQRTQEMTAESYSSDLQQVNMRLRVLYRIPETSVVRIFQDYQGDPFDTLIAPRVHEALKEVVAQQNAEMIVTNRIEVKLRTLELAQDKIGSDLLNVVDLVVHDISLSRELETAIEQKMIQEQEAAKARFAQRQAEIDAETAVIKARGVAESIRIRGEALNLNPAFIDLQIVEQWDGRSPLVISDEESGGNVMVPLGDLEKARP
jgi:prohibitin 2